MDKNQKLPGFLLFSVLVVATCGLIYELLAGTLASYLLGDSITQFSTIIGVYLFSMGIGSYLSRYFTKNILVWFLHVEILVGLVGGISTSALFILFEFTSSFRIVLYAFVVLTGILVGLEIPLIMRILKDEYPFKDLVSKVFTYDYIGALLASLVFPLVLVPFLGLVKTAFVFGLINVGVALWLSIYLENKETGINRVRMHATMAFLLLLAGLIYAERIQAFGEGLSYDDKIIYAKSTPYQRIVITRGKKEIKLFLNGNLQFSSYDEYRYHENLVHPAMQQFTQKVKVLILGGGDGMALREVLKYNNCSEVTLVDLDPGMTELFSESELLSNLNNHAFEDKRVNVLNEDAFRWLKTNPQLYDVIFIDFPDPSNFSVGKLYSLPFYKEVKSHLSVNGVLVVQSTSPYFAPKSFWCINETIKAVDLTTLPYHIYLPSFGDWGFVMAKNQPINLTLNHPEVAMKSVNAETLKQMCVFPPDISDQGSPINKLNNQVLVHLFEKEWGVHQ